ncbi:MAG: hypothetical protein ACYS9Y_09995 [Planctomycetota bacterium]|jgi:hypothetical protein
MTDNNIIKPVKGLQNIGALSPIQQRNKRKHNKNQKEQGNEDTNHDEAILSELTNEQLLDNEITEDNEEPNFDSAGIDYCA